MIIQNPGCRYQPVHVIASSTRTPAAKMEATLLETVDLMSLRTILGRDDLPMVADKPLKGLSRARFTKRFIETIAAKKGDGTLTFLATPRERHEQSHNVAEGFRLNPDYGMVLDPAELMVEGWSEKDYSDHWKAVRKAFAKDMKLVLGPGWERHPGCRESALQARELGIPALKVEVRDLDRTSIEMRLGEAEEELVKRGFKRPSFVSLLGGAVDQDYLADQATGDFTSDNTFKDPVGYVAEVVARTLRGRDESQNDGARQAGRLPQAEFTRLYVEQAKKQLGGSPMTYISTPITGGLKKFDLLERLGVSDKKDLDSKGKSRFVQDVILGNTHRAFRIAESVRLEPGYDKVMDPSEITIPEWSQSHYAAHWDAVVKELASRVVLAPGWDYSSGCILELKRALDKGIPIQEIKISEMVFCSEGHDAQGFCLT